MTRLSRLFTLFLVWGLCLPPSAFALRGESVKEAGLEEDLQRALTAGMEESGRSRYNPADVAERLLSKLIEEESTGEVVLNLGEASEKLGGSPTRAAFSYNPTLVEGVNGALAVVLGERAPKDAQLRSLWDQFHGSELTAVQIEVEKRGFDPTSVAERLLGKLIEEGSTGEVVLNLTQASDRLGGSPSPPVFSGNPTLVEGVNGALAAVLGKRAPKDAQLRSLWDQFHRSEVTTVQIEKDRRGSGRPAGQAGLEELLPAGIAQLASDLRERLSPFQSTVFPVGTELDRTVITIVDTTTDEEGNPSPERAALLPYLPAGMVAIARSSSDLLAAEAFAGRVSGAEVIFLDQMLGRTEDEKFQAAMKLAASGIRTTPGVGVQILSGRQEADLRQIMNGFQAQVQIVAPATSRMMLEALHAGGNLIAVFESNLFQQARDNWAGLAEYL